MSEMSVAEQRYKAVLAVVADGRTITEVAASLGISRQTLHTWLPDHGAALRLLRRVRPLLCPSGVQAWAALLSMPSSAKNAPVASHRHPRLSQAGLTPRYRSSMPRRRSIRIVLAAAAAVLITLAYLAGYAASPDSPAHLLARTADEWVALGTWLAVMIAAVAAGVGLTQAREARVLRVEQARPYVIAIVENNPFQNEVVELVITNVGKTEARDVRITSDRTLRHTGSNGAGADDLWLPTEIPMLAPGQEWRTVWDFSRDRLKSDLLKNEDRHVLTITYRGIEVGVMTTTSVLDWGPFKGRTWMEVRTSHHQAKAIEKIAKVVEAIVEPSGRQKTVAVTVHDDEHPHARTAPHRVPDLLAQRARFVQGDAAEIPFEPTASTEEQTPPASD